MDITPDAIPWTSDDEANWREFLHTKTGSKLIPKLLEATPGLLPGGGTNEVLIRSGEVRGINLIAREMLSLTHAKPVAPTHIENFPDLDDDSKWPEEKK